MAYVAAPMAVMSPVVMSSQKYCGFKSWVRPWSCGTTPLLEHALWPHARIVVPGERLPWRALAARRAAWWGAQRCGRSGRPRLGERRRAQRLLRLPRSLLPPAGRVLDRSSPCWASRASAAAPSTSGASSPALERGAQQATLGLGCKAHQIEGLGPVRGAHTLFASCSPRGVPCLASLQSREGLPGARPGHREGLGSPSAPHAAALTFVHRGTHETPRKVTVGAMMNPMVAPGMVAPGMAAPASAASSAAAPVTTTVTVAGGGGGAAAEALALQQQAAAERAEVRPRR